MINAALMCPRRGRTLILHVLALWMHSVIKVFLAIAYVRGLDFSP